MVRRRIGVDRPDERLLDAPARVGLGLEEVVQPLVTQALDLAGRERRLEEDLGDEVQGGPETRRRDVHPDRHRVPAGLRVKRGAEPLAGLGELDGVAARRALGQGATRQDRRPALVGGFLGGAADDDHRRGHERPPGQVDDDDRQPVRE